MSKKPQVTMRLTPSSTLIGQIVHARDCDRPIAEFLGVPYATPPIGVKRFRPPEFVKLWTGSRTAHKHGAACPQDVQRASRTYGRLPNSPKQYSEDCLYLNIWTPNCTPTSASSRLPVMVWLHGGAFVQGYSNIYEGAPLAAYEDVVVISINYRVGVFGFLQTGDGELDYHGNQGLLDQLEALRWIQKYIKHFGGDPANVTLFGQSAGGMSISFHLTSPDTHSLYNRVIIQSGPGVVSNSAWPKQGGQKYWWKRLHAMGFEGRDSQSLVTYLTSLSTDALLAAFDDWYVPTVVDGTYLPEDILVAYQAGHFHGKDCIIGFNSNEGVGFVPPKIHTRSQAEEAIRNFIMKSFFRGYPQAFTDEVYRLSCSEYLDTSLGTYQSDVSDFYGDLNFVAPSLVQAECHHARGRVYMYEFDHRPIFSQHPDWVRGDHGNEIPYMFGYPYMMAIPDVWTDEERQLSRSLMKYWANFARYGNPNGVESEDPIWNQYIPASPSYLHIQASEMVSRNMDQLWPSRMKLWNYTVPKLLAQHGSIKAKY